MKCADQTLPAVGEGDMFIHSFCFKFTDPEYKQFLETYSLEEEKTGASPETLLGEIEVRTRELLGLFARFFIEMLTNRIYIFNSPFFKMRVKFLSVTGLIETVFSTFDKRVIGQGNISQPLLVNMMCLVVVFEMMTLWKTDVCSWLGQRGTFVTVLTVSSHERTSGASGDKTCFAASAEQQAFQGS